MAVVRPSGYRPRASARERPTCEKQDRRGYPPVFPYAGSAGPSAARSFLRDGRSPAGASLLVVPHQGLGQRAPRSAAHGRAGSLADGLSLTAVVREPDDAVEQTGRIGGVVQQPRAAVVDQVEGATGGRRNDREPG